MGMDLVGIEPTDRAGETWHANWAGWGMVGELLDELGCDTSLMAGTNDGDVVDADTARQWADAVAGALAQGRVGEVTVASDSFAGGTRTVFLVAPEVQLAITSGGDVPARTAATFDTGDDTMRVLGRDDEWLGAFVDFCRTCGGFEQW